MIIFDSPMRITLEIAAKDYIFSYILQKKKIIICPREQLLNEMASLPTFFIKGGLHIKFQS
jgi:hypothetical protein